MSLPGAAASIAGRLASVPAEAAAALVLRHAEREAIPPGTFGEDVRLTSGGIAVAERLGSLLSTRKPSGIRSSPLPRCTGTARAIAHGAGWEVGPVPDRLLGDHGPFVTDASVCGPLFLETGIRELVGRQLSDEPPPPEMRPTGEGVGLLLDMVSGSLGRNGRLHVHVTHDAILAVVVGHLFRLGMDDFRWPAYLDGLLLWRLDGRLHFSWRGLDQGSDPTGG